MDNFLLLSQTISDVLSKNKISNLQKNFYNISNQYREEKINSNTVVSSEEEVLTYISSRMMETSAIIDAVLNKINNKIDIESFVETVLDFGSGIGSTMWALENYKKKANVLAVEKENSMIQYSKILSAQLTCNITYIQENVLSKKMNDLPKCDMVIESFMLNELTDKDRIKAVALMCEKTNGLLVLIEPGTPKSYERMMEVRNFVLSKGFELMLPCAHSEQCALKNDYCNFSVRVERTKTGRQVKGGTLGFEDEKYFYLVFTNLNKETLKHEATVLRKPFYRKGCVDLKLCTNKAEIKTLTVTKSDKVNYKKAKDYKHGDVLFF